MIKEADFKKTVWRYYRTRGRRTLPWRKTKDPYRILVSEIMLQQTQVERVVPKYKSFFKRFPSVRALANASLGAVLKEWQGLGYNRRAKMLHSAAKRIVGQYKGKFPGTLAELRSLPGVGPYTGGAILAFSFNVPVPIIETNIRTVVLHHYFPGESDVHDREALLVVGRTLDRKNPREWYYAMMDYGAHLKKTVGNTNVRSKHYTRQSAFRNSDRQIRGAIIREVVSKRMSRRELHKKLPFDPQRIDEQLERLTKEGMLTSQTQYYTVPDR